MSAGPDPERLRRDSLSALGGYGDPRARDALAQGIVVVIPDVKSWDSSMGTVRAHRVEIGLTAELFEAVTSAPAVQDAITAAVAKAVAQTPRESLAELEIFPVEDPPRDTPYRGRFPLT